MAHKKAGGSTRLGRDSKPKYLGVKVGGGEMVKAGEVLIRQRGTRIHPGKNVKVGRQDTIYSLLAGKVVFNKKKRVRFDGNMKMVTYINVIPDKTK